MKLCPQCKRSYVDDSLRFCLNDGSVLVRDEDATQHYGAKQKDREDTVSRQAPLMPGPAASPVPVTAATSSSSPILTAGVVMIAVLLLVLSLVGVAFVYKYWKASDNSVAQPVSSPSPAATHETASPTRTALPGALQINTSASSVRYSVQANTYDPANAIDNNKKTAWIEGVDGSGVGEWLRFDFGREINLHRIVVLPGYFKSPDIWAQNNRLAAVTLQFSDGSSQHFNFPDRMERQVLDLGAVKTRWMRLVIDQVYSGSDPDTAVSEVVFEWEP
ncbi:MAG TPA: discoidin domain-containing protein [Pyrinomonadaceae bacterium]|nr:discoidin domain-containing protein [Pyrinomonadaceae bacterium]